ncbi:conserved hypothetical protein [Solidesulfovibrio fructosivorans JJ]]|uniref:Uncharacterized protein n=1 Tax=Solidesulfovibrio fructosivorans JJ] TaxID=596151 RepID=E1JRL7_SOLFR|nr:hypothetical protein [Solidesulfovibrio fructosivorans]EFL53218.1 conserved hypothetical protein [Solidesulfovibrio fructosivorans JJ]]
MMPEQDTEQCDAPAAFWPPSMERGRVADAAFARAYAAVTDRQRSLLKTGIAAIYAACGGPMPPYRRERLVLGHDLVLDRLDTPLDFAVVLCGAGFASPARLAAAVIPALCARVPEVAAVRVGGGSWPQPLLTTLELCGVETACRIGVRALAGLWRELARQRGRGAVVLLDGVAPPAKPDDTGTLQSLTAKTSGRCGILCGPDDGLDREALRFAQPDMAFSVHSHDEHWGAPFAVAPGGLAEATECGYDALYVAPGDVRRALGAAPLVLAPGRETFWLWPRLSPDAFRRVATAAAVKDSSQGVF